MEIGAGRRGENIGLPLCRRRSTAEYIGHRYEDERFELGTHATQTPSSRLAGGLAIPGQTFTLTAFMIAWNEGYYSREHGLEDWPLVPIAPPPPPESPPPFNEGVFVEHDEVSPRHRLSPEPAFASPRTMARAMARTQLDIRADCEAAGLFTKKGPKSAKKAEAEEDGEEDGEWGGRGQKKKKGKKKEEKKEEEKKKQPQRGQKRKAWELPSEDDDDEEMEMEMEKENVAPPRGRPRPSYDFGYTAEEADNELTAQN
ncbi:hypothetical protein KC356_g7469 [Hortaea werneckii]|nr:hypothetical protein KC356_g7469 [Hortaea werneckii]